MKEKKKKRAQLPFRTNIIFFIIFLLFSALIFQLGVVQILNGEEFQEEIDRTIQDITKIPVPRGKIYDTNGNLVVDNKALYSITYTPPKGVQAQDRLEVAEKLAEFISMDSKEYLDKITDRDIREYVYLKDLEKNEGKSTEEQEETYEERIPDEKKEDLSNAELYRLVLDSIPDEDVAVENFTKQELEVIRIKKELDKAYSLTPQIVKNENVTSEEYALVSENLDKLPGINATTDWDREYIYDQTLRGTILGNVTSHEAGIPADEIQQYMSRGYSRNDRVGTSGLEKQYEEVLRGRKEQIEYTTTKTGVIIDSETIVKGERGKDLVLTLDMEFQQEVDKILEEELEKAVKLDPYNNQHLTDALAVVMNPQTGELISVAGKYYDKKNNQILDAAQKSLHSTYLPGSVVKGATVLAGYQSGAIKPGDAFFDSPIYLIGNVKKSLNPNIGLANDIKALKQSSNVYMFYIALRMGGETRYPFPRNSATSIDTGAWQEFRNYFRQFGLGAATGVDFPYEEVGSEGDSPNNAGLLMDFAIGQYNGYTTIQLAQYVSTIANGGYRVRPHFVKEIREPIASQTELGPIYRSINTEYLNRIQMSEDEINRVQEGFRQVFQEQGGTAYSYFADKDYNPAGKTGTAENPIFVDGVMYETINRSIVGYAPADDPEVAFAVMVPNIGINAKEDGNVSNRIAERILDTYFEMQEADEEDSEDGSNEDSDE